MRVEGILPGGEDFLVISDGLARLMRGRVELNVALNQRHCPLLCLLHVMRDVAHYDEEVNTMLRTPVPL